MPGEKSSKKEGGWVGERVASLVRNGPRRVRTTWAGGSVGGEPRAGLSSGPAARGKGWWLEAGLAEGSLGVRGRGRGQRWWWSCHAELPALMRHI